MANAHHHEERAPERTTPQGTQENGVLHGHEVEDTNVGSILKWFAGIAISGLILHLVLSAVYGLYFKMADQAEEAEGLPAAIFQASQAPPEPRLLPNPVDSAPERAEPMQGPVEYGIDYRRLESEEMVRLGLRDEATGRFVIPEKGLRAAMAESGGTGHGAAMGGGHGAPAGTGHGAQTGTGHGAGMPAGHGAGMPAGHGAAGGAHGATGGAHGAAGGAHGAAGGAHGAAGGAHGGAGFHSADPMMHPTPSDSSGGTVPELKLR